MTHTPVSTAIVVGVGPEGTMIVGPVIAPLGARKRKAAAKPAATQ